MAVEGLPCRGRSSTCCAASTGRTRSGSACSTIRICTPAGRSGRRGCCSRSAPTARPCSTCGGGWGSTRATSAACCANSRTRGSSRSRPIRPTAPTHRAAHQPGSCRTAQARRRSGADRRAPGRAAVGRQQSRTRRGARHGRPAAPRGDRRVRRRRRRGRATPGGRWGSTSPNSTSGSRPASTPTPPATRKPRPPRSRRPAVRSCVIRTDARHRSAAEGCNALDDGTGEIKRMWIHPDWRGLGLGRRLVDHLEQLAAEARVRGGSCSTRTTAWRRRSPCTARWDTTRPSATTTIPTPSAGSSSSCSLERLLTTDLAADRIRSPPALTVTSHGHP